MVSALLAEYAKAGPQLSVQYIDAEREPTRLAGLNVSVPALQNGTLIVRSPGRTKLLNQSDMFQQTPDGNVFSGSGGVYWRDPLCNRRRYAKCLFP